MSMGFSNFNALADQRDYLKNLFNRLWDHFEGFCNFHYRHEPSHSKKFEELAITLWSDNWAKKILESDSTPLPFIKQIDVICREPLIPDFQAFFIYRDRKYVKYPSDKNKMPIKLKIWHAYNELAKSRNLQLNTDYLFDTLIGKKGDIIGEDERADKATRFEEVSKEKVANDYVYAIRILYQIRCNLIHPSTPDEFYPRDVLLVQIACLALIQILRVLKQIDMHSDKRSIKKPY